MTTYSPAEVIGARIDELCINESKLAEKVGMDRTSLWKKLNKGVKFVFTDERIKDASFLPTARCVFWRGRSGHHWGFAA